MQEIAVPAVILLVLKSVTVGAVADFRLLFTPIIPYFVGKIKYLQQIILKKVKQIGFFCYTAQK